MSVLIPRSGLNKNPRLTSQVNPQTSQIVKRRFPNLSAESGKRGTLKPVLSLIIAITADALDVAPPLMFIGDGLAVIALLAIWGFRREIVLALIPEVIPGISLFPTWTAAVIALWFQSERPKPKA